MSDGSHSTFLRAELKPHVEKLSEQEEQRSVVRYRPHGPYEEWLMYHSPLTERQDATVKRLVMPCIVRSRRELGQ
ncbi:hypothetical protein SARC_08636, partial [Sphaeroforma arctica JP610]